MNEQDPALTQEELDTDTDPLVTEDAAESPDESEDASASTPNDDQVADEPNPDAESAEGDAPAAPPAEPTDAAIAAENAELKRKLKALEPKPDPVVEPGEKPTYAGCGFDDATYDAAMAKWNADVKRKTDSDAAELSKKQVFHSAYVKSASALVAQGVDVASAQAKIVAAIPELDRQDWLLAACDGDAKIVLELANDQSLLDELGRETNPVVFARKIGKLEATLSAKPTPEKKPKAPPPPEERVTANGRQTSTNLDQMREKARESGGDFTDVIARRRADRQKGKK